MIIPVFIYRYARVAIPAESSFMWANGYCEDVLSWWKSVFVVGSGLWMAVQSICNGVQGTWKRDWRLITVAAAAAVVVVISAALSKYPVTSWLGYPAQYEGALALLAYVFAVVYVASIPDRKHLEQSILHVLCCMTVACAGLGIVQGLGLDPWRTPYGQWLIGIDSRHFRFSFSAMAYGTSFQPNHYGMLMAMLTSLALGMMYAEVHKGWTVAWKCACALGFVAVVLSGSRAALGVSLLVGCALAVVHVLRIRKLRRCMTSGTSSGRVGSWRRTALWLAVVACLLGLASINDTVRDTLVWQVNRSIAEVQPRTITSSLSNLELIDNELVLHTDSGRFMISATGSGGWSVERGPTRQPIETEIQSRNDGWFRLAVPRLVDCHFTYRADGRAQLRYDDIRLNFFAAGTKLFAVDRIDRLIDHMVVPRHLPTGGYDKMLSGRIYVWSRALGLVPDHPLLGSGPGTFALVFPNASLFDKQRHYFTLIEDKPHGMWIGMLVQLGAVGLAIFLALFLFITYRCLVRGTPISMAIFAGMLAFVLGGITNDSTVGVTPVFCVLCGLGARGGE